MHLSLAMCLAALAPWRLSASVLCILVTLLPVPPSSALVVSKTQQKKRDKLHSLLSIEQVPGPTPQYVAYGPPEFTTFSNMTMACKACIEFFPEKQDGSRFHSQLYEDRDGGVWPRVCRAGSCDFRDPQTDPVGGVIGKGVGPGRTPDGKSCITRDPVQWYSDCEPIVEASVSSLTEVTRYCSYKEQVFIPPPSKMVSHFAGSQGKAWSRIGGDKEQCMQLIETQGSNLFDTMTFCDTNLPALSGCCETVFSALNCVAETASTKGLWSASQGSIFANLNEEGTKMLETFAKYCVPLCQNDKASFCENYPTADICVTHNSCSNCTAAGGLWCPKLESCHCPSKDPPCIKPPVTTPLQCLPKKEEESSAAVLEHKLEVPAPSPPAAPPAAAVEEKEEKLCKYAKFARQWARRDAKKGEKSKE